MTDSTTLPPINMGNDWSNAFDGFWTTTGANGNAQAGWGQNALGAANGLWNSWNAFQQVQIARDTLSENKRQFNMNWDAQKTLTNAELAARQTRLRSAMSPEVANSLGILSADDYVAKNGVK